MSADLICRSTTNDCTRSAIASSELGTQNRAGTSTQAILSPLDAGKAGAMKYMQARGEYQAKSMRNGGTWANLPLNKGRIYFTALLTLVENHVARNPSVMGGITVGA